MIKTIELEIIGNQVARSQKPENYPERFFVPDNKVSWDIAWDSYNPTYFSSETLEDKSYGESEDMTQISRSKFSDKFGTVKFNTLKQPMNPVGRTGISGRGILGKWGANQAVDTVILTIHPTSGLLCFLSVLRTDNNMWAITGGMVDGGETKKDAAIREVGEEVPQYKDLPPDLFHEISIEYGDDYRNTDNSWIESTIFGVILPSKFYTEEFFGFDPKEIKAVSWLEVKPGLMLHASNADYVYKVVKRYCMGPSRPKVPKVVQQCAFLFT